MKVESRLESVRSLTLEAASSAGRPPRVKAPSRAASEAPVVASPSAAASGSVSESTSRTFGLRLGGCGIERSSFRYAVEGGSFFRECLWGDCGRNAGAVDVQRSIVNGSDSVIVIVVVTAIGVVISAGRSGSSDVIRGNGPDVGLLLGSNFVVARVEGLGLGAIKVEPPIADEVVLVENGSVGAQERVFGQTAETVGRANVEHLTLGFNVGVITYSK